MTETERLLAAISLMNEQVSAGEGVSILHYFDTCYPGDPATKDPALADYCRELLKSDSEGHDHG